MKIVILDAATLGRDADWSAVEKLGEVTAYDTTPAAMAAERIADNEVAITNKVRLGAAELSGRSALRLISVAATGTNNIDSAWCRENGIAVANAAGYSTASVVQLTFALALSLICGTRYHDEFVRNGKYSESGIFTHTGRPFFELSGKRWGIIGFGAIGKGVAAAASAFGARPAYYSTSGANDSPGAERLELSELLATSDVVSVHAPLNDRTRGLIGYAEISRMKSTAFLLNLGRGGIIVESDLARAVDERLIAGAGVDVYESEPLPAGHPFLGVRERDRLLLTPHIAWTSVESRRRLTEEMARNIESFVSGGMRNRIA